MSSNNNVLLFEGYDGSGKSTLIERMVAAAGSMSVRIVGRKNEPALQRLSFLIERADPPLDNTSEVLLRFALEIERLKLISAAADTHDIVIVDRTFISAYSWANYYGLAPEAFDVFAAEIRLSLTGAKLILCDCPFEVCWGRIEPRPEKSKKEAMGKTANARFHGQYYANCRQFEADGSELSWTHIQTAGSIEESVEQLVAVLATCREE